MDSFISKNGRNSHIEFEIIKNEWDDLGQMDIEQYLEDERISIDIEDIGEETYYDELFGDPLWSSKYYGHLSSEELDEDEYTFEEFIVDEHENVSYYYEHDLRRRALNKRRFSISFNKCINKEPFIKMCVETGIAEFLNNIIAKCKNSLSGMKEEILRDTNRDRSIFDML